MSDDWMGSITKAADAERLKKYLACDQQALYETTEHLLLAKAHLEKAVESGRRHELVYCKRIFGVIAELLEVVVEGHRIVSEDEHMFVVGGHVVSRDVIEWFAGTHHQQPPHYPHGSLGLWIQIHKNEKGYLMQKTVGGDLKKSFDLMFDKENDKSVKY